MFSFLKNISPTEIIVLGCVLLLLFGSRAFKKLGKTTGETYKEIKNIKKNINDAFEEEDEKAK